MTPPPHICLGLARQNLLRMTNNFAHTPHTHIRLWYQKKHYLFLLRNRLLWWWRIFITLWNLLSLEKLKKKKTNSRKEYIPTRTGNGPIASLWLKMQIFKMHLNSEVNKEINIPIAFSLILFDKQIYIQKST